MLKEFHTRADFNHALDCDRTQLVGCFCKILTEPQRVFAVGKTQIIYLDLDEWAKLIKNSTEGYKPLSGVASDTIDINEKIIYNSLKFTVSRFALFASKAGSAEEIEAIIEKGISDMMVFIRNFHQEGNLKTHFRVEEL